jgi:hypothetical protein
VFFEAIRKNNVEKVNEMLIKNKNLINEKNEVIIYYL